MELECGGHKGGWMRIANVDTSRGDDCPSGWTKITTAVAACIAPSKNAGCYSANFSTLSIPYNKICGMAVGYQRSTTDGFANFHFSKRSINGPYVDGVSITYGTSIGSMCGPMHQATVIWVIICHNIHLTVHALNFPVDYHHLLFMITTIVNQVQSLAVQVYSLTILCGMVTIAPVITVAVLIPACHGSIVSYH